MHNLLADCEMCDLNQEPIRVADLWLDYLKDSMACHWLNDQSLKSIS